MPPAPKKTTISRKPTFRQIYESDASGRPRRKTVTRKPSNRKKKGLSREWKFVIAILLIILLSPFYYAYIIKGFSSTWRWIKDLSEDPSYRTYSSFDIRIPRGYDIHGIDVSYYQGKIDWKKVKAMQEDDVKVDFVFIKATEGLFMVDPYFQRNWREAPKSGLICGAYHFFRAHKPGLWQAKFFLQMVNFEAGDLPPVVDIEALNGVPAAEMRKQLKDFVNHIERKTKVRPIIYTGLSFYTDYLKGYFEDYPLWIAHYHQPKLKISAATKWYFWQHSDKAKISGINHVVDFNAFNGDSLAFDRLLIR